jgi:DNA helicase-2/ATP-dependent DNA helicase PcrA
VVRHEVARGEAPGSEPDTGSDIDLDALLRRLDDDQRAAVTAPPGPVLVVAGAGSGKTRVLTSRIAYRIATGSARPANVVAFTFTRHAAAELDRRLSSLGVGRGVVAGTFHSVAYRILRRRWADRGRTSVPTLATHRVSVLTEQLGGDRRVAGIVANEIEWARARLVTPDLYVRRAADAGRRPSIDTERVAHLYASFEQYKRKKRLLDFDDLLSECITELSRPGAAEAVAWWHRHLHIDEFQDINPLQFAFVDALRHGGGDLFAVGDPAQAIYGWNGADPQLLEQFAQSPMLPITVTLPTNYRSTPQVVAAGDHVLRSNRQIAHHRAHRETGEPVITLEATDESHEAREVVRLARTLREPGARWSTVAVLARTHDTLARLAQAFADAGVPTRVVTRQRDGENAATDLLRAARSARDPMEVHRVAVDLQWPDDIDPDADAEIPVDAPALDSTASDEPAVPTAPTTPQRVALEAVRAFEADGGGDGKALQAWLELNHVGASGDDDAVHLVTMHASKGREWPTVIVAAVDTVGFPTPRANRPAARAEEVRLLYVSLTRAQDRLAVTWATERNGSRATRSPLLPVLNATRRGVAAPEEPAHVPVQRPGREVSPRDAALERLRLWRSANARAARLPETFLLDDATLERIVDAAPHDERSLAAVAGVGSMTARRFGERILAALSSAAG